MRGDAAEQRALEVYGTWAKPVLDAMRDALDKHPEDPATALLTVLSKTRPNTTALASALAEATLSGLQVPAGEDQGEELAAANPWGCNGRGHKPFCPRGNLRDSASPEYAAKRGKKLRPYQVDQTRPEEEQVLELEEILKHSADTGKTHRRVFKKEGLGWIMVNPGGVSNSPDGSLSTRAMRELAALPPLPKNATKEERNERKELERRIKRAHGGYGLNHILEERHGISCADLAEAIISGTVSKDKEKPNQKWIISNKIRIKFQVSRNQAKFIHGMKRD